MDDRDKQVEDDELIFLGASGLSRKPMINLTEEEGEELLAFLQELEKQPPTPELIEGLRQHKRNQARHHSSG